MNFWATFRQILAFIKKNKTFVIAPILAILLLMIILILLTEAPTAIPFIYAR